MHNRSLLFAVILVTAIGFTLSTAAPPASRPSAPTTKRDLSKLSMLQRQFHLCAQRGTQWLQRANRTDGRFINGYIPSLRAPIEGDDFLRQASAAFTMARAARYFHDKKPEAVAKQALLTLLLETTIDKKDPNLRYTTLPSHLVDRLSSAGMLVAAIHELPTPGEDLLEQSQQMCKYIRRQQNKDGSFRDEATGKTAHASQAGPALYGLIVSQRHLPADWKVAALQKGCKFYSAKWRQEKTVDALCWHIAAYAEGYLRTGEKSLADAVNEVNDWITELQYRRLDHRRPLWLGGFRGWENGQAQAVAPDIGSADFAICLVEGCRVARKSGDVQRWNRNKQGLERSLQFVTTLQYTEANAQHFADWYRKLLVGAFHASHQDGDLRLDYTERAVSALLGYLQHVAPQ